MSTLLYQKTNFVLGDINGGGAANWIVGPAVVPKSANDNYAGSLFAGADPSGQPIFDLRRFKVIRVQLYTGGYTGTNLFPRCFHYDQPSPHPGFSVCPQVTTGLAAPSGGGGSSLVLTDTVAPQSVAAGVQNEQGVVYGPKPMFAQFQIFWATLTALTSLRLTIYGDE